MYLRAMNGSRKVLRRKRHSWLRLVSGKASQILSGPLQRQKRREKTLRVVVFVKAKSGYRIDAGLRSCTMWRTTVKF